MSDQHEHEHENGDDAEPVDITSPMTDEDLAEHEEAEHEPEHELQEASAAVDQKVIDRFFAQLDNEAARHAKRIGDIMGEEAQSLNLCPTCGPIDGMPNLVGFVLDAPLHGEAVARMRAALGLNVGFKLKPDPYSHACETCDAAGYVDTRSRVPDMDSRVCDDCKGRGYIMNAAQPSGPQLAAVNGGDHAPAAVIPQALGIEPPEAEALRRLGWAVIPPMQSAAS